MQLGSCRADVACSVALHVASDVACSGVSSVRCGGIRLRKSEPSRQCKMANGKCQMGRAGAGLEGRKSAPSIYKGWLTMVKSWGMSVCKGLGMAGNPCRFFGRGSLAKTQGREGSPPNPTRPGGRHRCSSPGATEMSRGPCPRVGASECTAMASASRSRTRREASAPQCEGGMVRHTTSVVWISGSACW